MDNQYVTTMQDRLRVLQHELDEHIKNNVSISDRLPTVMEMDMLDYEIEACKSFDFNKVRTIDDIQYADTDDLWPSDKGSAMFFDILHNSAAGDWLRVYLDLNTSYQNRTIKIVVEDIDPKSKSETRVVSIPLWHFYWAAVKIAACMVKVNHTTQANVRRWVFHGYDRYNCDAADLDCVAQVAVYGEIIF